jgi:2-amino-4-hydroxy-6-hydroxymethyldihydropteridine diphosphokinase
MPQTVYLALGARDGRPRLRMAEALQRLPGAAIPPSAVSSLWETEPVGLPEGAPVLNAAVASVCGLDPRALLAACLGLEEAAGRRRSPPEWRSLDVDVLLYGDLVLEEPGLSLPHPRFHRRRFNLAPLAEIAPDLRHPVLGRTISDLLAGCTDPSWVRVAARGAWWTAPEGPRLPPGA